MAEVRLIKYLPYIFKHNKEYNSFQLPLLALDIERHINVLVFTFILFGLGFQITIDTKRRK